MTFRHIAIASIWSIVFAPAGFAQTVGTEVQRDVNQENRVEQGLKSGQLSTGEAAKLERGEARIDRMETHAIKDGTLSPREAARIQRAQNQESARINRLDNNTVSGNPNSASSQRMEADVQRNINPARSPIKKLQTLSGARRASIVKRPELEPMVTSVPESRRASSMLKIGRAIRSIERSTTTAPADGGIGTKERQTALGRKSGGLLTNPNRSGGILGEAEL
jgi:hypothetical protein